jgi:hypothetical protein
MMNEEIKLKLEIEELKNKNNELEEKLKCYANQERTKKYYEKNREKIIRKKKYYEKNSNFVNNFIKEKAKNYMEKIKETNPEKLKAQQDNK